MKRIVFAIIAMFIFAAFAGCAPAVPAEAPAVTEAPTPSPSPAPVTPAPTPAPTPMPSDEAFESAAPPLSSADFTLELAEGVFCLLDCGTAELEALTGLEFHDSELVSNDLLFKERDGFIESVMFLGAPSTRGVRVGDTLDAVLEAYGTPSETNDFNDTQTYVYYVEPKQSPGLDFTQIRPVWFYAVGFTVSEGVVERAFIADWTDE